MNLDTKTWKGLIRAVTAIAVPVALQNLLTTTGSMVDTMMLAPLGENTVGAVGLCAQFSSLFFSCYWGFVGGGMLFFSQYHGAKDDKGICRAYGTTLSFMMGVSLIFFCLGFFTPETVLALYTDKQAIRELGVSYLRIACFAYPLQAFSMCMSALLRSTERVHIPMYAAIASLATNILFNRLLIHGDWFFPELGIRGAAVATVCAGAVNTLTILIFAVCKKYPYLFRVRDHFRPSGGWMARYLRKCFPILCNELLVGIGFMVNNVALGHQSESAIAAIAVFRTLEGLVIAFFSGFSNASSVLVGKAVGAGRPQDGYRDARRIVRLCAGCIGCVCVGLLLLRRPILTAMSLSGESYDYGAGFLAIYCVAAVIRMCNWTRNDTFRASGDSTFGTLLEILFMYTLVIPCVLVGWRVLDLPVLAVFALCYVDEPIRFLLMRHHMESGKWIQPVTPQGIAAMEDFSVGKRRKRQK